MVTGAARMVLTFTNMSAASARTVLLVDDSELLLEMATFHLEASGFEVVTASDIATLRRAIADSPPDLIILDVEMPDTTTAELIEAAAPANATIWLFSALDELLLAERAAAAGADGYVCKDAGLEELAKRAKELFSS